MADTIRNGLRACGEGHQRHRQPRTRLAQRPVITAGGLIFAGTWGDDDAAAYNKDTGRVLWEKEIEADPEGLPSVYEVNGRQFVVFCASGTATLPEGNILFVPGKPSAQGITYTLPR